MTAKVTTLHALFVQRPPNLCENVLTTFRDKSFTSQSNDARGITFRESGRRPKSNANLDKRQAKPGCECNKGIQRSTQVEDIVCQ